MSWPVGANRSERLRKSLIYHHLDALLALTPENASYLTGQYNYLATHWRIPGLFSAIVNRDGECAIVTGDFGIDPAVQMSFRTYRYRLWTESIDVRGQTEGSIADRAVRSRSTSVQRPVQFDLGDVFGRLSEAVRSIVPSGRIGLEKSMLPARLLNGLANFHHGVEFHEAGSIFDDLRALKDPDEIALLRLAGELTEAGIGGAIDRLAPGQNATAVNALYQIAVHGRVAEDQARYAAFRQAEGTVGVGIGVDGPGIVGPGQTVKFDMQVDVGGYHSDIGRTVAFAPTDDQRAIYAALRNALAAAQDALRPGATFAQVYAAGTRAMVDAGFAHYSRGHLGHSVGLTQNFEEPPFIAPDEHRRMVPGMVLSLELPYYVFGVGAFQLERMLLVTEDGHEAMDRLPFELELPRR